MEFPTPRPLLGEEAIAARVAELAARISADYAGAGELSLVGVLEGASRFLRDLSGRLTVPRRADFLSVAHYGDGAVPTGEVRLRRDLHGDIAGRHVLLVEDIVDTGATLGFVQRLLRARDPASLEICALLRKAKRRDPEPDVAYVGFEIADEWVVGYGLDYADRYRTLPYVGVIDPPG
ncbi:MAG: hypoxanthine phosphoribosyltransferase [Planctomycetota bacterium]